MTWCRWCGPVALVVPRVKLPGHEDFVRVDSLSEVSGVLERDPWSAWDAETDDSLLDAFAPKQPVSRAKEPTPVPEADAVEELPASALTPMETVVEAPEPLFSPEREPGRVDKTH